MVDEFFDRHYQEGRTELNAGLDRGLGRIGSAIGKSLKALHHIEWSAPWARKSNDAQCG